MYDMQKNNPLIWWNGRWSMVGNPEDIFNMMFGGGGGGMPFPFGAMGGMGGMGMPQVRIFHNGRPVNMLV